MLDQAKPLTKGFKFPIYPTPEQETLLNQTAGCCRYVWNRALADSKREHDQYVQSQAFGNTFISKPDVRGYSFVNKLPGYKADPASLWLADVSSAALQQAMLHLGQAYSRLFKQKNGFPQFKSKHGKQSFSLVRRYFHVKDGQFYIAKCSTPIALHWTRGLPSEPSSCTVSKSSTGQWYVSFICEYMPAKTSGIDVVGIDLGLKDFAVLSTGEKIANPRYYVKQQKLLKRKQQALSRKVKGSKNREKARLAVAQVHENIRSSRNNFLHQLSRKLVNENQVIGMETLRVANMVRMRGLSKAISDVGWSILARYVAYKCAESQHCTLVLMQPFYPSTHICSVDKIRLDRKLSLSERTWTCPECHTVHDRDTNAATNIRNEAARIFYDRVPRYYGGTLVQNSQLPLVA